MNGKMLNEGYKPVSRLELAQRGYQGGSNSPPSPRPVSLPTPPKTVSSVVKPKE